MNVRDGHKVGQFLGDWTTGVLAAALAADAPIASMRVGPTQTAGSIQGGTVKAYVRWISLRLASTVAFTAAQQFGLYLQRFSGANMAGGSTRSILNLHENTAAINKSVCLPGGGQAGDFRASDTAALTTAGVTLSGEKITVYGWSTVGPAEYPWVYLDFTERPLRLDVGEGLALFNKVVWPVAGTAVLNGTIAWDEGIL